jgi:hypothetical protein
MPADVALDQLDDVRIASPCPMRWDDLKGDGPVRHCERCRMNVYNFSDMTRGEIAEVLAAKEGRLCAGFYRRPDGTIMTRDCPVGVRALRRRARRTLARIAAAVGVLLAGGVVLAKGDRGGASKMRTRQPFAALSAKLAPVPPAPAFIMGDIALPPPPNPGPGGDAGPGS